MKSSPRQAPTLEATPSRPLRILFSLMHAGYLRHYAAPIRLLVERGHEVHLAVGRTEKDHRDRMLIEQLAAESDRFSYSLAPGRSYVDGWRRLAWVARGLTDIARFGDPRFAHSSALRARMRKKVASGIKSRRNRIYPFSERRMLRLVDRLAQPSDEETARRNVRRLARLERAIPPSRRVTRFIRSYRPDVVLASPVVEIASPQVEFVKSARRLGIPTGVCIASWDNLTNKGLIRVAPDRVFVWNEVQRRELVEFHDVPEGRVFVTGGQKFDEWFGRRPSTTPAEFASKVGLNPGRPFLLYLCSSFFIAPNEVGFVTRWVEAIRTAGSSPVRDLDILVRPHPQNFVQWKDTDLSRFGNVSIWPRAGAQPDAGEARAEFFDSLAHAAAVVGVNTSAMIEAGILGKSVFTVLDSDFAATQEGTLHFHYLRSENGGFLEEATSLGEHLEQLDRALAGGEARSEQTRKFVQSFVRPYGLDISATPIVAAGIEELALTSPHGQRYPDMSTYALRLALYPVAVTTSIAAASASLTRWARSVVGTRLLRRRSAEAIPKREADVA